MIETIATAESNRELAPGYRLLTLLLNEDIDVRAGQFAMVKARASVEPLLRRALAVYHLHPDRRVSFLYQVLGRGTQALAHLRDGDEVEALLPLGNSWPVGFENCQRAILVAGGIGSASLLMLSKDLARSGIGAHVFFGASNESAARGCGLEDFRALGFTLSVTTDDGSLGEKGLVTTPLERHLAVSNRDRAVIYACGPWAMMRRVAEISGAFETRCLVSLEAPMGCGFGVCVGCVVAVRDSESLEYGFYKRVCTDGSIFPSEAIRWEVNPMAH